MTGAQGEDFEAQARQYWNAWGEALRQGSAAGSNAPPEAAAQDWSQALSWWRGVLGGQAPAAQETVDRFSGQAGDWLGLMQQVAARFAGRDTSSAEVAGAWREAVEGQREQLLQWTLGALRGGVAGGFDPWLAQMAASLDQWRRDSAPWLQMPGLGLGRNHHARWQSFSRAQQDYQSRSQAYVEQLRAALDQAFERFQAKLSEHETLGSQLTSARALFDLWIEAAEEAYAGVALSEEFGEIYGAYANAHMRLRAAVQQEVEQIASQYGMPTRSEMDAAHKRIAELERVVRRMAAGRAADAPVAEDAPPGKVSSRAAAAAKAPANKPGEKAGEKAVKKAANSAAKKVAKKVVKKVASQPARQAARKATKPVAKKSPDKSAKGRSR